jgi:hypothetical protein
MPADERPLFNFFAIAGVPDEPEVCRVAVTADLQRDLSDEFAKQLAAFDVDGSELVPYDPQYKPDEGELFEIPGYALPRALADLGRAPTLPPLSDRQIEAGVLRALVGVPHQGKSKGLALCFQAVDSRQLLKRTRLSLILSHDVFSRNDRSGIVVRSSLTAVFRSGNLYFPAEPPVRRFLDLSQVFEEATGPQVQKFLRHPLFAVDDLEAVVALADTWTRRKIAAIERRRILESVPTQAVVKVGKEFGLEVSTRRIDGKPVLVVPADKPRLKDLLRLLDQDFLRSPLTSDRFRVNSKRRL